MLPIRLDHTRSSKGLLFIIDSHTSRVVVADNIAAHQRGARHVCLNGLHIDTFYGSVLLIS